MCVIIIKDKGHAFPSEQAVKNCCLRNPDGFSMAWNDPSGCLKSFRSMSMKAFLKRYKAEVKRLDASTTGMILHMRIATHGSTGIKNCHCWLGSGFAFAHNGILSIKNRGDMTDSETFFRDIFQPIYDHCGWEAAERAVNACIGTSKFAFLDKKGDIQSFGVYQEHEGCYYSNDSWRGEVRYYFGGYKMPKSTLKDGYETKRSLSSLLGDEWDWYYNKEKDGKNGNKGHKIDTLF